MPYFSRVVLFPPETYQSLPSTEDQTHFPDYGLSLEKQPKQTIKKWLLFKNISLYHNISSNIMYLI